MAEQKLRICDLCELNPGASPKALEDRVAIETIELRFTSGGKFKLDLCVSHLHALIELIPVNKLQSGSTGELVCGLCGKSYGSRNGLAYHLEAEHGDKEKARRIAGKPEQPPRDEAINCPECGLRCKSPQGLASHRRLKHPESADGKGQPLAHLHPADKKGKVGTRQGQ